MIAALFCLLAVPPAQLLKQVEVDRFNTAYQIVLSGTGHDTHEWPGLSGQQCAFYRRSTMLRINANPNKTTLTFTISQGQMTFASPKQLSWYLYLDYFTLDGTYVDLSNVQRFYVNCDQIPDIAEMSAYDKWFHGGVSGPSGQQNGIYFNRVGFSGNLDWKNIYNIQFRLDFSSAPNPLQFLVSRIYVTLKPGLTGPGSKADPLSIFGG